MTGLSRTLAACLVASTIAVAAPASAAVTVDGRLSNTGTRDIFFDWVGGAFSVQVDPSSGDNALVDPEIFLFRDNGSESGALTGALIENNDDFVAGSFSARIARTLAQGSYVLSVGTYDFTQAEARAGVADFTPMQRRFTATFSDGTRISGAVPEPATWAMMIGGFGLVGGAMRRRVKTKVSFA